MLLTCLAALGCAQGGAGDDTQTRRGSEEARDGSIPRDSGSRIPPGRDGGVTSEPDLDFDGVPTAVDCDDGDPMVGAVAERPCSSECGPGVEQCTDGTWVDCNAPTECDCVEGEAPRMLPCERCGVQRQVCVEGTWVDDGACSSGACSPGEMESGGSCGNCGTQQRTCQTDCSWSGWTCTSEGVCAAGTVETDSGPCGACGSGTRSRSRTCQATCSWGSWSAWGTCSGATGCAPGATRPCANGDSCGHEVCRSDCTWGGCEPISECLRIRPGTTGPEGNNYRCCGTGAWQFCLSSCLWSPSCEACSGCGC